MDTICAVFITNNKYFNKFLQSCNQLITKGNYKNYICLIICDDLKNKNLENHYFIKENKIIIKYFPSLKFPNEFLTMQKNLDRPYYWFQKLFQYNKFYLFDMYFKKWNYILYIDCGMIINSDIEPILQEKTKDTLLANRDGGDFENNWFGGLKQCDQFDKEKSFFQILNNKYNLNNLTFQTTMMLYDTEIIDETTFDNLCKLNIEYPISRTNDQGIISLYFTVINKKWKQLKRKNDNTYLYDYARFVDEPYIMIKTADNKWNTDIQYKGYIN